MPNSAATEHPQGSRAKLTPINKREIALAYVSGKSAAEICQEYSLSERGFYRLREEDRAFQAAVKEFALLTYTHLRTALRNHAAAAVKTLADILQVDACNFVDGEGPNGGKVVTRRIDNKLLAEKRMAAAQLVEFWLKLRATDEDRRRWDLENLSGDDNEEEEDDEDQAA